MSLKKIFFITSLIGVVGFISGCAMTPPKPKPNALQIQAMQTREFNAPKRKTFNAVMTVLQNDGYTISSANMGTGYITAQSATQRQSFVDAHGNLSTGEKFAFGMMDLMANGYDSSKRPTHVNYRVNVSSFITPVRKGKNVVSKVRLGFVQNKVVSGGDTENISTQILDTGLYQKTFNEIRQQIFVASDLN